MGCGWREVAAGSGAGTQGEISLAGQDGVSGIMGNAGLTWRGREGQAPNTFWTDGASGKETGVVQGVSSHGQEALLPRMEMEAADMAAGAAGGCTAA